MGVKKSEIAAAAGPYIALAINAVRSVRYTASAQS